MATVLKLYECVDDYATVLDWIEEHTDVVIERGGELPPELEALLEEVEGRVEEKVERTGLTIRNLAANAKAIDLEIERLKTRKRVVDRQEAALKTYLGYQLNRLGTKRVDGSGICPVRLQTNGPMSVRVTDPERAKDFFVPQEPVFSSKLAMELVKGDLPPKGTFERVFEDLGIVVERGEHIRVG